MTLLMFRSKKTNLKGTKSTRASESELNLHNDGITRIAMQPF